MILEEIILVKSIKTGRQYPGFIISQVDFEWILKRMGAGIVKTPDNEITKCSGRHIFEWLFVYHRSNDLEVIKSKTNMSLGDFCSYLNTGGDKIIIILEDKRPIKIKKRLGISYAKKSFKNGYVRYFGTKLDTTEYQKLKTLNININTIPNDINRKFLINEA